MWEDPNQIYFHQYFLSDDHIGLMNGKEFFWMRVLKTIAPLRLNINEGYDY